MNIHEMIYAVNCHKNTEYIYYNPYIRYKSTQKIVENQSREVFLLTHQLIPNLTDI